jgi:NAD(P)-dependent dehydrogenase (short-subunit alcohol dehydrogenase family)
MVEERFRDKLALVTGASSGIGRAAALALARDGGAVALVARRRQVLDEVSQKIAAAGGRAVAITADVTSAADRARVVEETVSALGGIDVLVNAAGIIAFGTIENTTLEAFTAMFDLNVTAVFHLMQLALPHLEERRGSIVNVSSVTGLRSFPGVLSYCSSKAAVDHLTRCAALELAPRGVRVNAVNPGVVVSGLHRTGGLNDEKYAAFLEHSRTTHPIGRVGQADEIADLILFLSSSQSGWITGTTTPIDGGRHLTCAR